MKSKGLGLPDFSRPPVVEVALSVQFEPLESLRTPQIGLLWQEFKNQFPKVEEHGPLNSVVERFGLRGSKQPNIQLEMMQSPPMPRCWFLNADGTELIQVQKDRFAHNWRKAGEGDLYPRYEHVRDRFCQELETFRRFLTDNQIGELSANQCEVTYVNQIISGEPWERHGQLGEVLTVLKAQYSDSFLSEPEDAEVAIRYVICDDQGERLGRLHVTAKPAFRSSDDQPIFVLTLTARGKPEGDNIQGIQRFLDRGREWVVRGFVSITEPHMHQVWSRQDDK